MQAQDVTVVDDISTYTGDAAYVYSKANGKTYALNNLGAYELYGVYVKTNTLNIADPSATNKVIDYIYTDNDHLAYINTGYVHTTNTKIVAEVEITQTNNSWQAIFGSRRGITSQALAYFWHTDNSERGCLAIGSTEKKGTQMEPQADHVPMNTPITVTADEANATVSVTPSQEGGTSTITSSSAVPADGYNPIFIFDLSTGDDGHADGSRTRMRLYSFKIYEGETLVKDYEPIVSPEGKGGLHDKISGDVLFAAGSAQFLLSPDAEEKLQPGISVYTGKMVIYNDNHIYKYDGSGWTDLGARTLGGEIANSDYKNLNNWVTNDGHMDIFSGNWQPTANGYKIDPYVGTGGHEPLMTQVPLEVGADYNYSFTSSWGAYNSWHSVEMHAYVCNFWDLGTQESGTSVSNSVLATQTFSFDGGTNIPFSLDFTADRENQTLVFQFGDVDDGEKGFWFEFDNLLVQKYLYPEDYPVINPFGQQLAELISEAETAVLNTTIAVKNALNEALANAKAVLGGDDLIAQKDALDTLQEALNKAKQIDVTVLGATMVLAQAIGINTDEAQDFLINGTDNNVKEDLLYTLRSLRKLNAATKIDPSKVEGSEPAEGEFYLLNMGTGLFLNTTADWGTHISVDNPGMLLKLTEDGIGNDFLTAFHISGNGWDGFNWSEEYWDKNGEHKSVFRPVEGKDKVYYWNVFDNFDWHFVYDVADGWCDGGTRFWNAVKKRNRPTADYANDLNAQWKLVSKTQLLSTFDNATETDPVDATFLINNPNFTKFGGQDVARGWEGVGEVKSGDRDAFYVIEYFEKDANLKQTIENLPAGYYQVSVNGFFRDGTTDNETSKVNNGQELIQTASLVAINGSEDKVSTLLPNVSSEAGQMPGIGDVVNELELANWPWQANEYFHTGLYKATTAAIEVGEDGKLTIGIENTHNGNLGNWVVVDNFRLTYLGTEIILTDIKDIPSTVQPGTEIYNLQGVRVQNPQKGLYIIGGKKVVVK